MSGLLARLAALFARPASMRPLERESASTGGNPPLSPLNPLERESPQPSPQTGPRSWRNCNPGNVRPVSLPDKWVGETAIDTAPGGPFSIFGSAAHGWRAVAKVLLTYQDRYKLRSVRAMLYRYAPPQENPTDAYVASVCKALGVGPDDAVDVREPRVMRQLLVAIAAVEGGRSCPAWPEAEMAEGMRMAGVGGD